MYIYKRPFVDEFLRKSFKLFNLVMFTASDKKYADAVLDIIDPEDKYFFLNLYRHNCILSKSDLILKSLNFLKNLKMSKTIFVDNCTFHLFLNMENSVPIFPYSGEKND